MEPVMGGSAGQEISCLSRIPKVNYFACKVTQLDSVVRFSTLFTRAQV